MQIINDRVKGVDFRPSPNTSGKIREFKYITIHDDAGASMDGTTSWLQNPASKVSYHILIGKDGSVRQFVDFDKRAWHCGVSEWKGLKDLNWYTIGVCMQNRGNEPYTAAQIDKAIKISKLIAEHYGIKEAVRHKDIAPKRKVDPNQHFPWEYFQKEVFGKSTTPTRITTPDGLNLREGIGTSFPVISVLNKGTEVNVLSEKEGWSEVFICSTKQRGWVSSRYLK